MRWTAKYWPWYRKKKTINIIPVEHSRFVEYGRKINPYRDINKSPDEKITIKEIPFIISTYIKCKLKPLKRNKEFQKNLDRLEELTGVIPLNHSNVCDIGISTKQALSNLDASIKRGLI